MNRKQVLLALFLILTIGFFSCSSKKETTQVLVIGTIHNGHNYNPNYSFQDLVNILGTFNPDAICVEIRPSDFRKQSYLKEMMVATIFGTDNNKQVYPIDWWPPTDPRAEQVEYKQTDDYNIKKQIVDSLEHANMIMQHFIKTYGELDDVWEENKSSYEFINGKDYNDYIREWYTIGIDVYGDGCMFLYSNKRNAEMMAFTDNAIAENKGKRMIIFVGAEHKYFFDIALSKRNDVTLLDLENILPLKEIAMSKNLSDFIEKNLARGYYDTSDASSIDLLYSEALFPLLHNWGKAENPNTIPGESIEQAKLMIAEWETYNPQSVDLHFHKAWTKFLEKDYQKAIEIAESVSGRLDEIKEENPARWFLLPFFWRNLGLSYDMTGEREKAIAAYQQGKKTCIQLELNENLVKIIFRDFENEPYRR
jgi:tetratricopeptide (TPR) repeat protein